MRLKTNADAAYVDWELPQLFPQKVTASGHGRASFLDMSSGC
jgi:hypothetical protein